MSQPVSAAPFTFFTAVSGLSIPFYVLGTLGPDLTKVLPIQLPISAIMVVCPAAVALWFTFQEHGSPGVHGLLGRIVDIQRIKQPRWLLVSFFLMPAVLLLSFAVQKALGQTLPEASITLPTIIISFAAFFVGAAAEELGWTGYIIEPLQQRYGARNAALLIGAFWALWHIIPYAQAHRSSEWILWKCAGTVALRVLLVWLYNNAGQSLFSAIALHAMNNVSEFSFPHFGSHYDPKVTGLILIGIALLVTKYGSIQT